MGIWFYAFNFYSKEYKNMEERVRIMEARARAQGLGPFIDNGNPIKVIDHTHCVEGHDIIF